ncbi:hypothetical protein [Flavobacterium cerinum]|uniref:DUF402 domain-containing protein n=1 Tax=Flavobacterium cerinum TaxID=2502784 RepID=A0ABY5J0A4_9FLAO|nr:hypothetical protein [Flavobacterium cerinum]UUC47162.1 hypothetical protein NOX80_08175 [Flavobacterium cerinum]
MKFDLIYKDLKKLNDFEYEIYEGDSDYLNAYIGVIQDALRASENVTFELNCLGEDWNVMVFYDFSLFTEHLLDIYQLCDKEKDASYAMWYYEDGIDRDILFTKVDHDTVKIENVSGEKWITPISAEYMTTSGLKAECVNFVQKIKEAISMLYPEINELEMIQEWYRKFGV